MSITTIDENGNISITANHPNSDSPILSGIDTTVGAFGNVQAEESPGFDDKAYRMLKGNEWIAYAHDPGGENPIRSIRQEDGGPLMLEGLGVVFTDHKNPDLLGTFFMKGTDFNLPEQGKEIPVMYSHGYDSTIGQRKIGTAHVREMDAGVWAQIQIDMHEDYLADIKPYLEKIRGFVEDGILGLSSGSALHTVDFEPAGRSWWIKQWWLHELSLTVQPAEFKTLENLDVLKRIITKSSLWSPLERDAAKGPRATAGISTKSTDTKDEEDVQSVSAKEMTMSATQVIVPPETRDDEGSGVGNPPAEDANQQFLRFMEQQNNQFSNMMNQFIEFITTDPRVKNVGYFSVDGGGADKNIRNKGDFMLAVVRQDYKRIKELYSDPTRALGTDDPTAGGVTVPPDFRAELIKINEQISPILAAVDRVPVFSRAGSVPALNQQDVTFDINAFQSADSAGVQAAIVAENDPIPETNAVFRKIDYRLWSLGGLQYASNQLLKYTAIQLEEELRNLFTTTIRNREEATILRGTGSGMPLGIVEAPCKIALTNGATGTFDYDNVLDMNKKLYPQDENAVMWVFNRDLIPKIGKLEVSAGSGGVYMASGDGGFRAQGDQFSRRMLMGYPQVYSQFMPLAAASNTFAILADFSTYALFQYDEMQIAVSEHYRFGNDQMAWRFTHEIDGKPKWHKPKKGGDPAKTETSPMVVMSNTP